MTAAVASGGPAMSHPVEDALPPLREELSLYSGTSASDGSPTWSLHDPVRNLFFRIDWPTFEVIARWSLGSTEAIAFAISNQTTLQLDANDIDEVRRFLIQNQLVQMRGPAATASLVDRERAMHSTLWQWLLHHYLFFRIPLFRPNRWLEHNLKFAQWFYSRRFFQVTGVVLLIGLFECFRQWPLFKTTLVDTFSLQGAIGYACAITFVKCLHELGHAFTAKRKGCRVPTMGVAFLVMWPVAYTDVNEVWKLSSNKDRLAVGAAGIVTELIIAAWATLAWSLLPDGGVRNAMFLLATTTWISTIAVNASPFMRFDGYFLLSDLLDFPNLHARAFALARWDLRERLFQLGESVPEHMPAARRKGLIIFAWLVWFYRLALFLGIAALVYHFFIKALGIVLFAVEIGYFVAYPIWREIAEWRKRAATIRTSSRAKRSFAIFLLFILIACVPWNTSVRGQGMLRTARHFALYAPEPAQVKSMPHRNGDSIKRGELVLALDSPDLDYKAQRSQAEARRLAWQLEVSGLDESLRTKQSVIREQLASTQTEVAGYAIEHARLTLLAPFDGIITDLSPTLREGAWTNRQEKLGELIDPSEWQVEAYLEDRDARRVRVGDHAKFFPETAGQPAIDLEVVRVDADATRQLPEPMLAVQHGGQVIVREHQNQLTPDKALFRIVLTAHIDPNSLPHQTERGRVVIAGEPKSLIGAYLQTGLNVLIRESGW